LHDFPEIEAVAGNFRHVKSPRRLVFPSMTPQEALAVAQSLHQSGDLAGAETAYRQILASAPDNTIALGALAEIVYRTGRNTEAL